MVLLQAHLYLGHMEDVLRLADETESLVKRVGRFNIFPLPQCAKAWVEFGKVPNLDRYETELRRALQSDQKLEYRSVLSEGYLGLINFLRGNWPAALAHTQASCRSQPPESTQGFPVALLLFLLAYTG